MSILKLTNNILRWKPSININQIQNTNTFVFILAWQSLVLFNCRSSILLQMSFLLSLQPIKRQCRSTCTDWINRLLVWRQRPHRQTWIQKRLRRHVTQGLCFHPGKKKATNKLKQLPSWIYKLLLNYEWEACWENVVKYWKKTHLNSLLRAKVDAQVTQYQQQTDVTCVSTTLLYRIMNWAHL